MKTEQKYLKKWGLVIFVAILGMAPPLSTDMYMPSFPEMARDLSTSELMVNMTMVVFFVFMALGMLVFGPLSDKYGRRWPLIAGLLMYSAGSIGCSISPDIIIMILLRCVQSLGAGAMVSLSVAIIKDCFDGRMRDNALAVVQSLSVIAPILSPVIGAMLLKVASWRAVFVLLSIISLICVFIGLLYQESLPEAERNQGGLTESLEKMAVVGRNINFTPFLFMASVFAAPFMSYLAVASYTYQEFFGLSSGMFAVFFAINAAFSVLGPMIFIGINGKISGRMIVAGLLTIGYVFSVLIYVFGEISPVVFLCCFIPYGVANSFMRPFATAVLLEQQEGDTGAASALLNFCYTLFSAIGMMAGSMGWSSYIHGLGGIIFAFTLAAMLIWIYILRSKKINMKHL